MKIHSGLVRVAGWFLAILPALWLLTHPVPVAWLVPFARAARAPGYVTDHFWPLFLWCLAPSLFAWRDWKWRGQVTFAWIAILFCSLQAYCFNTATHPALNPFSIWGFLPSTDGHHYLNNAVEIAEGVGIRLGFGARQMWPGFLAVLHVWSYGDLKLMLSLLTLMQSVVTFITWEVMRSLLGRAAAFLWLCCIALFYRTHVVGVFVTEQLGLPLGMLAAVILLYAWRERSILPWLLGLLFLTFSLNTRPGCYFVLGFLLFGTFWRFRPAPLSKITGWNRSLRGLAWRRGSIAIGVISLCFIANDLSFRHLVNPPRLPSNFWMVLYGTAKGGTWADTFQDLGEGHFNLKRIEATSDEVPLSSFLSRVKQAAIREIAAKPEMLFYGTIRAWQYVVVHQTFFYENSAKWWGWLLLLISAVALLLGTLKGSRAMSDSGFYWLIWLGVFLSLPLAPPWDSGPRSYAATDPLVWLLPAAFCSWCGRRFGGRMLDNEETCSPTNASRENDWMARNMSLRVSGIAGMLLIFSSVVLPNILLELNRNKAMPRYSDLIPLEKPSPDIREIDRSLLRPNRGILVYPAEARTFVPGVAREDFERGVLRGRQIPIGEFMKDLPNGSYIALLGRPRYLICDPSVFGNGSVNSNIPLQENDWMAYKYIITLSKGVVLTARQVAILCPSRASHEIFWLSSLSRSVK